MTSDQTVLCGAALALLLAGSPLPALGQTAVTLEELSVEGEAAPAAGRSAAPPFGVAAPPGSAPAVIEHPVGEIVTGIGRDDTIANRPATSIGSVLVNSPGVTVRQG